MRVRVVGEEVPVARVVLARLRDKSTGVAGFRRALRLAGVLLAAAASGEVEYRRVRVETPLGVAEELEPVEPPLVVAVLGAGVVLAEGFLEVFEDARLGLLAARRVEEEGGVRVEVYYSRLPSRIPPAATVFVVDPMLATASTVSRAVGEVKARGAGRVVVASVIAAREGLLRLAEAHPDVSVYTLAVDPKLDDRFFIVPGLGDAGDRSLGVEPG